MWLIPSRHYGWWTTRYCTHNYITAVSGFDVCASILVLDSSRHISQVINNKTVPTLYQYKRLHSRWRMTITSISRTLLRTHLLYGSSPTYLSQAWSCQLPKAIDSVSRVTNTWPSRTLTAIPVTAALQRYMYLQHQMQHNYTWLQGSSLYWVKISLLQY